MFLRIIWVIFYGFNYSILIAADHFCMKYVVEHDSQRQFVCMVVTGNYHRNSDAFVMLEVIHDISEKFHITHVLFDMRKAIIHGDIVDTYEFADKIMDKRDYFGIKMASVYSKISENEFFMEYVLNNRGLTFRPFEFYDDAMDWLFKHS